MDEERPVTDKINPVGRQGQAPNIVVVRDIRPLVVIKDLQREIWVRQEIIQGNDELARIEFLAGMCEAKMSLQAEAEARVTRLATEYPTDPAAGRALFWIGSAHLQRKEYEKAIGNMRAVSKRFPDIELDVQAAQFVKNYRRG